MPPSSDGSINIIRNVDVDVNNVLNGLTVQILNNNDIDVQDVADVTIVDNVLIVVGKARMGSSLLLHQETQRSLSERPTEKARLLQPRHMFDHGAIHSWGHPGGRSHFGGCFSLAEGPLQPGRVPSQ